MSERIQRSSTRIGVGLAACALVLTGCSTESPSDSQPPVMSAETISSSAIPSPTASESQLPPSPSEQPLPSSAELLSNPDLLKSISMSDAVRISAEAAVQVHTDASQITDHYANGVLIDSSASFAYRDDAPGVMDGGDGSGVVVRTSAGQEAILSAGHVVEDTTHCAETTVSFQVPSNQPIGVTALKQAANYTANPASESVTMPDMGLIITKQGTTPHNVAPLASKAVMNPGDLVFALTYQPEADGTERNPGNVDDTKYPAEYDMMILGKDPKTGLIAALERGSSLGKTADNRSREGASGGEIVDPAGHVLGVVEGGPRDAASTAFEISAVKLGDPNFTELNHVTYEPGDGIMYIQPVDQMSVDDLYNRAKGAPDCKPRPHKRVG